MDEKNVIIYVNSRVSSANCHYVAGNF